MSLLDALCAVWAYAARHSSEMTTRERIAFDTLIQRLAPELTPDEVVLARQVVDAVRSEGVVLP